MPEPMLQLEGLKTYFRTETGIVRAVDDISLVLQEGEILALVGESGSGKSVTSLTVMRLLPEQSASHPGGRVSFLGRDLLAVSSSEMTRIRGADIAMIFQEPMTSLNPVMRVGDQVAEAIRQHEGLDAAGARERTIKLFEEVGIPNPETSADKYPHEMSGGQKQRVMIAMALSCNPRLLIADEPTTALDVTIQAQILDLIRGLQRKRGMSVLFITHDLGVVAEIADKVAVMFRGRLVESGEVEQIFEHPSHPYTKSLLACRPALDTPYRVLPTVADFMDVHTEEDGSLRIEERELTKQRTAELMEDPRGPVDVSGEPLLSVRDLTVRFPIKTDLLGRTTEWFTAVDGVSFDVWEGQTLGLVGESGCGKTTIGRAVLRLLQPSEGQVLFEGRDLAFMDASPRGEEARAVRRRLQIVFQDPYASLNPRQNIEAILTEPMVVHGIGSSVAERRDIAASLLEEVDLDPVYLRRYPHEFSGGQRQRICIARSLTVKPRLIVCDESVSALDVSVQAQVLNLLRRLQAQRGLTYVFISHDLSVVKFMSDTMCVMKDGQIVEAGNASDIYRDPQETYTQELIAAIPGEGKMRWHPEA